MILKLQIQNALSIILWVIDMDQAQNLRKYLNLSQLAGKKDAELPPVNRDARIITVSSGKGGVGKTNFSVNIALALAKMGKRVSIIDADLGLANVDVLMDLVPQYTLNHVIRSEKTVEEIIIEGPFGLNIISGGSGLLEMANLDKDRIEGLIEALQVLNERSDYILIDTGAGLNESVISFVEAADDVILVVTPDPTSITDAYALIKNIHMMEKHVKIVVNRVDSTNEGLDVFNKISAATKRFLNSDVEILGYIYEDGNVKKSVKMQKPFLLAYPNTLASKGVELIATNIERNNIFEPKENGFKSFINKLFSNI